MPVIRQASRVAHSPLAVWEKLADFGGIADWFGQATHGSLLTAQTHGVGATRRVQLPGMTLVETVVQWDPERALAYDVTGLPPIVAGSRNRWTLTPDGTGTRIELSMEVALAAGPVGRLAYRTVLGRIFERSSRALLHDFVRSLG